MDNWFDNWTERFLFVSWTVLVGVFLLLFLYQMQSGLRLKTNILELMPASEQDPVFETSRSAFEGTMGKTVLLLVDSHQDADVPSQKQLDHATKSVKQILSSSEVFQTVKGYDQSSARTFYDLYFPYRYQILAPSIRKILESDHPVDGIKQHIRRNLHRQSLPVSSDVLEKDPLLFFPALVEYWSSLSNRENVEPSETQSRSRGILIGRLNQDPMSTSTQKTVHKLISRCRAEVARTSGNLQLRWTGLVRIAKVSRNQMQNDASFIGTISLIGVILLVYLAFCSFRQLFILVCTVLTGLITAFSVSALVFDIHVITIAFGATLIGISVDYAFHYFCNHRFRPADWTPRKGLMQIFPGISFGLITSIIAFASLALTPLPALRQIAFFTSIGLLGAYLTVVCWFPFVFRWMLNGSPDEMNNLSWRRPFLFFSDRLLSMWEFTRGNMYALVALGAAGAGVLLLLGAGYTRLNFNDNIEDFAQIPESLKENDRYIRQVAGIENTGRYILVQASTKQQLLSRQEQVHQRLNTLQSKEALDGAWGIGQFLPSAKRQTENRSLVQHQLLANRNRLRSGLKEVGYNESIIDSLFSKLEDVVENNDVLTPTEWLNHSASFGMQQLWLGSSDDSYSSLIILKNIQKEQLIERTFRDLKMVHYRNRRRAFTNVMRQYRVRAISLASIAYAMILLFLIFRYGFGPGILMFLPASLGSAVTLSVLSLSGISFNLMHVLAVLIILGMGIDYTIFLVEEGRHGYSLRPPMLALLLSALTTVFSFGSLAFSQATVINSIGIVVFPGILLILLLSPMVCLCMPHE